MVSLSANNGGQLRGSIPRRVAALLGDLLLGAIFFTLFYRLAPAVALTEFLSLFTNYTELFQIYIWAFFLQLFFTLIFGRSLFETIFGLEGVGGHAHQRLAGIFRCFFGFVTTPFIIFDLLLFFDRVSIKELFSGAPLFYKGARPIPRSGIILFPLVIILLYAPLLEDGLAGFKVNVVGVPTPVKLAESDPYVAKWAVAFKSDSMSDFVTLPHFVVMKEGSKIVVTPSLIFYHKESRASVEMKANTWQDDLFPFPMMESDRVDYLKEILPLTYKNFHTQIYKRIWVKNDLLFRERLIKETGLPYGNQFEILPLGDHLFLSGVVLNNNAYEVRLLPLFDNGMKFYITYDGAAASAYSALLSKVLLYASFEKREITKKRATLESEFTLFHLLDLFVHGIEDRGERTLFEDFIYHHYFDLAKDALSKGDEKLVELLAFNLERLILVAQMKNTKHTEFYSERFINFISTLVKTLKKRERAYYGIY